MDNAKTWKLTKDQKDIIARQYAEGTETRALAHQFGVTEGAIRYTVRMQGVPRRSRREEIRRPLTEADIPEKFRRYFDLQGQQIQMYGDRRRMCVERTCRLCGEKAWVPTARVRYNFSSYTVCCNICQAKEPGRRRKGKNHPSWKGGRHRVDGYVYVHSPEHPAATTHGRVLEHRLVMEEVLGRYLAVGETVHHKNGIRDDNRPENLELWTRVQPAGIRSADAPHCPTCTCHLHPVAVPEPAR